MNSVRPLIALLFTASLLARIADAAPDKVARIAVNYSDAASRTYLVPDPLRLANGRAVNDAKTW